MIRGNHDERYLKDKDFDISRFEWVKDYAEIHAIERELLGLTAVKVVKLHGCFSKKRALE